MTQEVRDQPLEGTTSINNISSGKVRTSLRKKKSERANCVWLLETPGAVARQAALSTGFPKQGY